VATLLFFSCLGVREIINLIQGRSPILSG